MPQLDVFSYPTQLFWFSLIFIVTVIGFSKYFFPILMLILRIRTKFIQELEKTSKTEIDTSNNIITEVNNLFLNRTIPLFNKVLLSTVLEDSLNKTTQAKQKFLVKLRQERLISLLKAKKVNIPLLLTVAPLDDFILIVSFLTFFIYFYLYYAQPLIKDYVDVRILELKERVLLLKQKQTLNLKVKANLIEKHTNLTTENAILSRAVFAILEKQNSDLKAYSKEFPQSLNTTFMKDNEAVNIKFRNIFKHYFTNKILKPQRKLYFTAKAFSLAFPHFTELSTKRHFLHLNLYPIYTKKKVEVQPKVNFFYRIYQSIKATAVSFVKAIGFKLKAVFFPPTPQYVIIDKSKERLIASLCLPKLIKLFSNYRPKQKKLIFFILLRQIHIYQNADVTITLKKVFKV